MNFKKYKIIKLLLIFIILLIIYYKLTYLFVHEYIFMFRFEDDIESIINSILLSFIVWLFLSSISLYFFNKYINNKKWKKI